MAVTLRPNEIKLRTQTGEYQSPVVLGDTTVADHVAQVNAAITAKGEETLESIPEEYTELSGDVAELKSALNDYINAACGDDGLSDDFVIGSINAKTGVAASSNTRIRSVSRIPEYVAIEAKEGFSFFLCGYDNVDGYVGWYDGDAYSKGQYPEWLKQAYAYLPNGAFVIVIRKDDNSEIDVDAASNIIVGRLTDKTLTRENRSADAKTVGDNFKSTDNILSAIVDGVPDGMIEINFDETILHPSYAINGSGVEVFEDDSYCSKFVNAYKSYAVQSTLSFDESSIANTWYHYVAFYNAEKTFLSRIGGKNKSEVSGTIPENTAYIRVSLTYIGLSALVAYTLTESANRRSSPKNKWYVLGDSISAGYYSITDEKAEEKGVTISYRPAGLSGVGSVWDRTLAHNYWGYANEWFLHREQVGKAYPGQGYYKVASNDQNGIYVVKNTDFSDAGLITVAWGFNDWHYNQPRGDHTLIDATVKYPTEGYDTSQLTTVNHAIWYCLGELIRKAPQAKIVVQTPMNGWLYGGDFDTNWGIGYELSQSGTIADIHDDIVYWANYYGLQIMDMTYNNSVVNRLNIQEVLLDGSHPSDPAHMQLGRTVGHKLLYG